MGAKNSIVGMELGSSKICVLVGIPQDNRMSIIGIGESASNGIKKGAIIDIEAVVESASAALKQAELISGSNIESVYISLANEQIRSFNNSGMHVLKSEQIKQKDVEKAINVAESVSMDRNRCVLHVIPQEFIVDGQRHIKNPVGKTGIRLESKVHIITSNSASVEDVKNCMSKCGIGIKDAILSSFASSYAVLSDEEKQGGTILVDIGAGTTDLVVFKEGSVVHSAVIPMAGGDINYDIAHRFGTSPLDTELIKKKYGYAVTKMIEREDIIDLSFNGGLNSKRISRTDLAETIEARVEDIFERIYKELLRGGCADMLSSGGNIVLTGGTSELKGIIEFAGLYFEARVRKGFPNNFDGLKHIVSNPCYSTPLGLVLIGSKRERVISRSFMPSKGKGMISKVTNKVKVLCDDYF